MKRPYIVALGGALNANSSTEKALRVVMRAAERLGAETALFAGEDIDLPSYMPGQIEHSAPARRLVEALRRADGVIVGSPGYHGGVSGLVKNALDYIEELRVDERPYLDGRSVGCLATAGGWQGAVATLGALRNIVHALRGWPTPVGVSICTAEAAFGADGACLAPALQFQLELMARQIVGFAAYGAQISATSSVVAA